MFVGHLEERHCCRRPQQGNISLTYRLIPLTWTIVYWEINTLVVPLWKECSGVSFLFRRQSRSLACCLMSLRQGFRLHPWATVLRKQSASHSTLHV
jgi:hypothetical protein